MPTSAMQDFITFAQSIGQASDSLVQLRETRVALAQDALTTKIQSKNASFLKRLYLPVGDPEKITPTNWQSALSQYDQEVEGIMGTVKDDGIQSSVRARLAPGNERFLLDFSSAMYAQEQEYLRSDYNAVRAEIQVSAMPEEQKVAELKRMSKDYSGKIAFTPEEQKQEEFDIRGLEATMVARDEISAGATPRQAKEKLAADESVPSLERDAMDKYYDGVQGVLDSNADEAWNLIFSEPSKTWQVGVDSAYEQIEAWRKQGVSEEKLAAYEQALYSYDGGVSGQRMTDYVDAALAANGGSFSQDVATSLLKRVNEMPTKGNKVAEEQQTIEINRIKSSIREDGAGPGDKAALVNLQELRLAARRMGGAAVAEYTNAVISLGRARPDLLTSLNMHYDEIYEQGWVDKDVLAAVSIDGVTQLMKNIVYRPDMFGVGTPMEKIFKSLQKSGMSDKDAAAYVIASDLTANLSARAAKGEFKNAKEVEAAAIDAVMSFSKYTSVLTERPREGWFRGSGEKQIAEVLDAFESGELKELWTLSPGARTATAPTTLKMQLDAVSEYGQALMTDYVSRGLITGISSVTSLTPAIEWGVPSFFDTKNGYEYNLSAEDGKVFINRYEYKDGSRVGDPVRIGVPAKPAALAPAQRAERQKAYEDVFEKAMKDVSPEAQFAP